MIKTCPRLLMFGLIRKDRIMEGARERKPMGRQKSKDCLGMYARRTKTAFVQCLEGLQIQGIRRRGDH